MKPKMEMIETLLINNHTEKGIADQEENRLAWKGTLASGLHFSRIVAGPRGCS
jgi:hypothetical protein